MGKPVKIAVRTVGQSFGCVGVITTQRGSEIMRCETVRPYGFSASALSDARAEADRRGWQVEESE